MSEPVTVLVTRRVRAGRERDFEDFLGRVRDLAAAHPGNQGMTVLPPPNGSNEYAIVYRFTNTAHLDSWWDSPERAELIAESSDLAEAPPVERRLTGLEGWFTAPRGQIVRPPARWKIWLTTLIALYLLLVTITTITQPILDPLPPPLRSALLLPVLTALMTWIVMPRLTRLLSHWLYD